MVAIHLSGFDMSEVGMSHEHGFHVHQFGDLSNSVHIWQLKIDQLNVYCTVQKHNICFCLVSCLSNLNITRNKMANARPKITCPVLILIHPTCDLSVIVYCIYLPVNRTNCSNLQTGVHGNHARVTCQLPTCRIHSDEWPPGFHVHQFGDLSNSCDSLGDIYNRRSQRGRR
jgi:ribonuclease BN (tRNA processing enzyme)